MITQATDWFLRYVVSNEKGEDETYIERIAVWRQSLTGIVTGLFPNGGAELTESENAYNGGTYVHKDSLSADELKAANSGVSVESIKQSSQKPRT